MAIVQVLIPYHLVTAGATAALGGEGNRVDRALAAAPAPGGPSETETATGAVN